MKIYISVDMEGISDIVSLSEITPGKRNYEKACLKMTREVNIIIDQLFKSEVEQVVVNDSHNRMDNIVREELDSRAKLISGDFKTGSMMAGIDESFAGAIFVGYHGRAGLSPAVIDHTYTFSIFDCKLNKQPLGEAGLNGRLAGFYGVPVIMLTGDQTAVKSAEEELNQPLGVIVKEATGRTNAILLNPETVESKLRKGVIRAIKYIDNYEPTVVAEKLQLEVTFTRSGMADQVMLLPGTKRVDGRTVTYHSDNYLEIYNIFRIMTKLTRGIN